MDNDVKYREGHFLTVGIIMGIPFGVALALAVGNFGLIGVGVPIGLALGIAMEEKYKREGRIRPLFEGEKRTRAMLVVLGGVAVIVGILALLLLMVWH